MENPGSRQPGLCYRSCPQWEGIDVYSVCFSMECCLSAIDIYNTGYSAAVVGFQGCLHKAFSVLIFID